MQRLISVALHHTPLTEQPRPKTIVTPILCAQLETTFTHTALRPPRPTPFPAQEGILEIVAHWDEGKEGAVL
jgi:hypothetical protein